MPADWLSYMLTESRRGAHLVLGTMLPSPALGPAARADGVSRHHLREGHPHVHGANLPADLSTTQWERTFRVNISSYFWTTRSALMTPARLP